MIAKAYDKKTAAFVGFMIQNVPDNLTGEVMQDWMDNPAAMKHFLSRLVPPEVKITKRPASFLSVIATTKVGTTRGKRTNACFTGSIYGYRDSDFDHWLGKDQPGADGCVISTVGFMKDLTLVESAAKVLGLGAGTDIKLLGTALIENGHTITLTQAEEMMETTERGEGTGMRTDGYGNFFFVETGNEDDPVSVGSVSRGECDWGARLYRFGGADRWGAGDRLLVRNLDTSKL